jgi:hypothetical protein
VFRIGFGLLVAFASVRFLTKGWVDALYLEPARHLTYAGFEWVRPLPAPWMHAHIVALGVLGLGIAAGWRTRLCAALFTAGFAYTELIDAALYLNHYWYVTLAGLLLVLLPTGHHWALDAARGRVAASATVPVVTVWALRAQLAVVYLFAGVAKLNPDWLLSAQPMRIWLADRADLPGVGSLLDEPWLAYGASWAGAAFDLAVVGMLLWRRSRPWTYCAVVAFHVATWLLFPIGVFPWVMIAGTLVFFPPDWPERVAARLGWRRRPRAGTAQPSTRLRIGPVAAVALAVLAAVEVVLPLRHLVYPGDVRWTEEGYYLSWRVMLTEKVGLLDFRVTDPASGRTWEVGPEEVLTGWQAAQAAVRPDLVLATARLVADELASRGIEDVEVRADSFVSMNGRPARRMVDPTVDLAAEPRSPGPAHWILPAGGG